MHKFFHRIISPPEYWNSKMTCSPKTGGIFLSSLFEKDCLVDRTHKGDGTASISKPWNSMRGCDDQVGSLGECSDGWRHESVGVMFHPSSISTKSEAWFCQRNLHHDYLDSRITTTNQVFVCRVLLSAGLSLWPFCHTPQHSSRSFSWTYHRIDCSHR